MKTEYTQRVPPTPPLSLRSSSHKENYLKSSNPKSLQQQVSTLCLHTN